PADRDTPVDAHRLENLPAAIDHPEYPMTRNVHVRQRQLRCALTVDRGVAFDADASRLGIDQEERDTALILLAARRARRHDDVMCALPVQHERLAPAQHETIAL